MCSAKCIFFTEAHFDALFSKMNFRGLLHSSASSQPTHPLVYMRALPYETLASVIDFIYHGEVEVEKEDLDTFLQVDFNIKSVKFFRLYF